MTRHRALRRGRRHSPKPRGTPIRAKLVGVEGKVFEQIGARLRDARETAGLTEAELEARLGVGPGWVRRFESARPLPDTYGLLAILDATGADLGEILSDLNPEGDGIPLLREFFGEQAGADTLLHFPYGKFDARYRLKKASCQELDSVVAELRNGLAGIATPLDGAEPEGALLEAPEGVAVAQSDAVANAFLKAAYLWPHVNPSDLWYFVVYRAYLDPYNHPAENARLDLGQSWKRTGGWALERVLVRHYEQHLREHDVEIVILPHEEKEPMLRRLGLPNRIEADKLDVALLGGSDRRFFGAVHVKASFAERRTDDVPMSQELVRGGFFSPLWTMDCKATPAAAPVNRGELGKADGNRSAKRKDIEDDGFFSGCFSYNANTQPTATSHQDAHKVHVCDFTDPDDAFARAVIKAWEKFQRSPPA